MSERLAVQTVGEAISGLYSYRKTARPARAVIRKRSCITRIASRVVKGIKGAVKRAYEDANGAEAVVLRTDRSAQAATVALCFIVSVYYAFALITIVSKRFGYASLL